jgi:co-chaperonin GroES (HSP10)
MQQAIRDRVFIKPDEQKHGAFMIEEAEGGSKSGIVQSVGPEVTDIKVGDHVVFYNWRDLPALDGLIAVRSKDLLGVLSDD